MTARVVAAARVCEFCGSRFERRRFPSGRLEDATRFADRRFCSRSCFRNAAADGYRVRPPGAWFIEPHQLKSARSTFDESDPLLAVGGRYPWDRQRGPQRDAVPGHFPADRQVLIPGPHREDRS